VGSESLLDRSKSIKSHLMALFPTGCANVEGVDAYQACYGGTAALLACTNWVESEAWDCRWAVCVCTDVCDAPAQYPFMNGAACVAMLVGADAPLALEGPRRTHMAHAWDFHKPVGWPSMGPITDGPGSMELYHKSLAACQVRHG
jgi:hydroxymethylglutaryl-CoA synthase